MAILSVQVAFTRSSGDLPATGLALADIDIYLTAQNLLTGADTVIWNGLNPTEEIDNIGAYARIYADADFDNNVYSVRGQYTGAVALDNDTVQEALDGASPWAFVIKVLSMSAAAAAAAISGSTITVQRAVDWDVDITGAGDITDRTTFYFSVKRRTIDADADALVRIEETVGLQVINGGVAATPGNGTLTVTNAITGAFTFTLAAIESAKLQEEAMLYYDFKRITAAGLALVVTQGRFNISAIVTGAIT